jgi:hypothetical protein
MLHRVILQLVMSICLSDFLTRKATNMVEPGDQHPQENPAGDMLSFNHWIFWLAPNDYVLLDHRGIHDLPYPSFQPGKSTVPKK